MNDRESFLQQLPQFSNLNPADMVVKLDALLNEHRKKLQAILAQGEPYTWENLMTPLEDMSDELNKFWSPMSHLHSVQATDEMRAAYNKALPLLTAYQTEISQNEALYQAILNLSSQSEKFDPAQKKILENDVRDFKLSGIHLSPEKKARLSELQKELSQLMTKFSENLLDATHAFTVHVEDKSKLAGLPAHALQLAKDNALARQLPGYVFTLDYPSYSTAIKFLQNRELRQQLYEAYSTRASDMGPHSGQWDNTPVMEDILRVRHEMARLVGFNNYAEYSLATKMAQSPNEVLNFLNDLVLRSKTVAKAEYEELIELAKADGVSPLEIWDISYYSEKLQASKFDFTQEDFRPFFPMEKVLKGLFAIVEKLYGIKIREEQNIDVWHPQVKFFTITDERDQFRGGLYADFYARPQKRDGAWMDECRARRLFNDKMQFPIAYLTCNFMPPANDQDALLTHDEVLTLFHEFGHCLHHLLTKVDYPSVGGISGVPWDAVEFPSQFMENFCWEKETLDLFAAHYETNEPLPDELYRKLVASKHFQTGLQMIRQLEFSLFDFLLHLNYDPSTAGEVQKVLDKVRTETSIISVPQFNRFQHSFSHIFAGSYAAGYYSYKWAEILSADAYSKFEENGILDEATGRSFMQNILEVGGVRHPTLSFIAFRGREPKIDALLKQSGFEKV